MEPKKQSGAQLIQSERWRQRTEEGYIKDNDRRYESGELCDAAIAYARAAARQARGESIAYLRHMVTACEVPWPWEDEHWKPSPDQIRNLVKAGALIAAEIDRLQSLE